MPREYNPDREAILLHEKIEAHKEAFKVDTSNMTEDEYAFYVKEVEDYYNNRGRKQ